MSKKLAEGSDALVLDVKCGDGAFMKTFASALALAEAMVGIGTRTGVRTEAFITDMEAPLGASVGNALEIIECLETLKGRGSSELASVVSRLAARMVVLAGLEPTTEAAAQRVEQALTSGKALETFARMIAAQGGDASVVEDYSRLPAAPERTAAIASRSGVVTFIKAEAIGRASNELGAGRNTVGDTIDHAVGIVLLTRLGDTVREGQPLLELHHRGGRGLAAARELCATAVGIGDTAPAPRPAILGEVR
jgi:thymidine phosphorylase